jgi:cell division protein FtsW (lipid II flippase)
LSDFDKQKATWEKTKSKGKPRYIILTTVLYIVIGLVVAAIGAVVNKYHFDRSQILAYSVVYLIVFCLFGIYAGFSGWKRKSRRFDE